MRYTQLESERLLYRKFKLEDFSVVYDWMSHLENMKYRSSDPKSQSEVIEFIQRSIACAQQEECRDFPFAVVRKEDNALIGSCGITYVNDYTADIHWELHRNYWRNGYGTEIGHTLLKFGFEQLHMHRIIADCNVLNRGSYRVMELNGMRREAHYVKFYRGNKALNYAWCDKFGYAMLEEEWRQLHSASEPENR